MKIITTVEPWHLADADHVDGFAIARIKMRRARWFGYVRRRFDLVSFVDLADWCAREPGTVERNEARRVQAISDLRDAVLLGEFGPEERLTVAYLPRIVPIDRQGRFPLRLTAGQIEMMAGFGPEFDLVPDLWAPRPLCARWFATRSITPPPWLSAPPASPASKATTRDRESAASLDPFVAAFLAREAAAGRTPTAARLEKEAEGRWKREALRAALAARQILPAVGRPRKTRQK